MYIYIYIYIYVCVCVRVCVVLLLTIMPHQYPAPTRYDISACQIFAQMFSSMAAMPSTASAEPRPTKALLRCDVI